MRHRSGLARYALCAACADVSGPDSEETGQHLWPVTVADVQVALTREENELRARDPLGVPTPMSCATSLGVPHQCRRDNFGWVHIPGPSPGEAVEQVTIQTIEEERGAGGPEHPVVVVTGQRAHRTVRHSQHLVNPRAVVQAPHAAPFPLSDPTQTRLGTGHVPGVQQIEATALLNVVFSGLVQNTPWTDATNDRHSTNRTGVGDPSRDRERRSSRDAHNRIVLQTEKRSEGRGVTSSREKARCPGRRRTVVTGPVHRHEPHTGRRGRLMTPPAQDPRRWSARMHHNRTPSGIATVPIPEDPAVRQHTACVTTSSSHSAQATPARRPERPPVSLPDTSSSRHVRMPASRQRPSNSAPLARDGACPRVTGRLAGLLGSDGQLTHMPMSVRRAGAWQAGSGPFALSRFAVAPAPTLRADES